MLLFPFCWLCTLPLFQQTYNGGSLVVEKEEFQTLSFPPARYDFSILFGVVTQPVEDKKKKKSNIMYSSNSI